MAPSIGEPVAAVTVATGEQSLGNQLQYLSSSLFTTGSSRTHPADGDGQLSVSGSLDIANYKTYVSSTIMRLTASSLIEVGPQLRFRNSGASIQADFDQDISAGTDMLIVANNKLTLNGAGPRHVIGNGTGVTSFYLSTTGGTDPLAAADTLYATAGTKNTQRGVFARVPVVLSTTASGANQFIDTFNINNQTCVMIEIQWLRRQPTVGTEFGNRALILASADGSGVVTHSSVIAAYSPSGPVDDPAATLSVTTGANTLSLLAVAQSNAYDWQFMVTAIYN